MIRLRPSFARLLALLLLVQWGLVFEHGMRPLARFAGGHSVVICGAEGLTTAVLDDEGRPVPQPAAKHGLCPGCCGPVALEGPAPPVLALPVVWPAGQPPSGGEGLPVAPPRAPPQQPRAPPTA
ncbi:DUF2946 family protein [Belnapia sp. F-4-1]|uniref:DUF2946 family protein n=1 Tax=Belnapia sp. F-4-1 TaxID=1545443 RepID=UPI0005BE95C4|nr:DUF2946 family protein [Belnapia sp. F-4-1]